MKGRAYAILVAMLLCVSLALATEFVVLESTSADYMAGQLLVAVDSIKLSEGEKLTVLAEDGHSYQHKGPYEGPLAAKQRRDDKTISKALGQLIGAAQVDSSSLAGVRGDRASARDSGQAGYDSPAWVILPHMNGTQCTIRGKTPRFWRPDASEATGLFLKQVGRTEFVRTAWPAAQEELAWPSSVTLQPGTAYLVRMGDAVPSQSLLLQEVPAQLAGQAGIVAWLEAKGCHRQARAVYAGLEAR